MQHKFYLPLSTYDAHQKPQIIFPPPRNIMERTEKSQLINSSVSEQLGIGNKISTVKGIAAILTFTFLVAISKICVQMLEKAVPDFELNTIRCGSYVVFMALYFAVTKTWPTVNRENWISVGLLCISSTGVSLTTCIFL